MEELKKLGLPFAALAAWIGLGSIDLWLGTIVGLGILGWWLVIAYKDFMG